MDDPSFIGAEGFEQLCTDADISMEGALPMLLAWQMDATEMAKITKEQWSQGMDVLQCVVITFDPSSHFVDNKFHNQEYPLYRRLP